MSPANVHNREPGGGSMSSTQTSAQGPIYNTPESLSLTKGTSQPMFGMRGLLNLLTWVEHRQQAQVSPREDGGDQCSRMPPTLFPPDFKQALGAWGNLPQRHRQQLLRLLSHLLPTGCATRREKEVKEAFNPIRNADSRENGTSRTKQHGLPPFCLGDFQ